MSQKNICGDKILFLSLQNQNEDIMPTLMNVFGLRFFFYSEEHLPMHVHIQNSDGKAKIAIKTRCCAGGEQRHQTTRHQTGDGDCPHVSE